MGLCYSALCQATNVSEMTLYGTKPDAVQDKCVKAVSHLICMAQLGIVQ